MLPNLFVKIARTWGKNDTTVVSSLGQSANARLLIVKDDIWTIRTRFDDVFTKYCIPLEVCGDVSYYKKGSINRLRSRIWFLFSDAVGASYGSTEWMWKKRTFFGGGSIGFIFIFYRQLSYNVRPAWNWEAF